MSTRPKFLYDEMKHCGVDYSNPEQVAVYDARHQKFRDFQKDAKVVIDLLKIGPDDAVLDMGAGTGAFSIYAAPYLKTVYAVDVSPVMLEYARNKAEKAGLTNIVFSHGGLLTYEHQGPPVDAIVMIVVLHHLPDFWKQVGLQRLAQMLKPGGRLYLFDVVFPSNMPDYQARFTEWVGTMVNAVGPEMAAEIEAHIRDEHSTFDWVMEGFLEQAGFRIDSADYSKGFNVTYICTKS